MIEYNILKTNNTENITNFKFKNDCILFFKDYNSFEIYNLKEEKIIIRKKYMIDVKNIDLYPKFKLLVIEFDENIDVFDFCNNKILFQIGKSKVINNYKILTNYIICIEYKSKIYFYSILTGNKIGDICISNINTYTYLYDCSLFIIYNNCYINIYFLNDNSLTIINNFKINNFVNIKSLKIHNNFIYISNNEILKIISINKEEIYNIKCLNINSIIISNNILLIDSGFLNFVLYNTTAYSKITEINIFNIIENIENIEDNVLKNALIFNIDKRNDITSDILHTDSNILRITNKLLMIIENNINNNINVFKLSSDILVFFNNNLKVAFIFDIINLNIKNIIFFQNKILYYKVKDNNNIIFFDSKFNIYILYNFIKLIYYNIKLEKINKNKIKYNKNNNIFGILNLETNNFIALLIESKILFRDKLDSFTIGNDNKID